LPEATCIYNLFPLLAGPIERWADHLPRIREMNFDWVYVNPFHYPGFSGSLYAIKDFDELHPIVRGGSARPTVDLVSDFANSAGASGLKVMMDLVVNHTSKDALLVKAHPEWYLREDDGSLRSPRAVDPVDPRKSTVWGDLAEIDYGNAETRSAQLDHWAAYAIRYAEAGIGGFRCDAAYQVPADFWRALIERVRGAVPGTLFAAETLGCTTDQALALADAGFDMLFNSAISPHLGCWTSTISIATSRRPSLFRKVTTPIAWRMNSRAWASRNSRPHTGCAIASPPVSPAPS